ncbi:MAG: hypothetical protein CMK92_02740 [Pseudomonas sp.]|nr:hypothetical protein [Pseudomonas sp.]
MDQFQYFCLVAVSVVIVLYVLKRLYEIYSQECPQCSAEQIRCSKHNEPLPEVDGEEGYESSDDEDSDDE